ncbi:Os08g0255140 [Oryza sativa Japonica Group]|uniref:Os08g0255140 protein n=2 Tax=Oryza sativa subsp. japonica TaxID=39947 RepID=Q6ZG21_ORYSJ|nr:unknown protein [Oryza sativa Japonica Group]BAT04573.1 Os08g0255140 [Oryza sativa Japonica Group]
MREQVCVACGGWRRAGPGGWRRQRGSWSRRRLGGQRAMASPRGSASLPLSPSLSLGEQRRQLWRGGGGSCGRRGWRQLRAAGEESRTAAGGGEGDGVGAAARRLTSRPPCVRHGPHHGWRPPLHRAGVSHPAGGVRP